MCLSRVSDYRVGMVGSRTLNFILLQPKFHINQRVLYTFSPLRTFVVKTQVDIMILH